MHSLQCCIYWKYTPFMLLGEIVYTSLTILHFIYTTIYNSQCTCIVLWQLKMLLTLAPCVSISAIRWCYYFLAIIFLVRMAYTARQCPYRYHTPGTMSISTECLYQEKLIKKTGLSGSEKANQIWNHKDSNTDTSIYIVSAESNTDTSLCMVSAEPSNCDGISRNRVPNKLPE